MIMTILKVNQPLYQTSWQTYQWYFPGNQQGMTPELIGLTGLVMLSAYSSIYMKVEDYRNKICWHWIQMGENGSSLDFSFILLPSPTAYKNWISQLSSVALFVFEKYCCSGCSNWLKKKYKKEEKLTECSLFSVLWQSWNYCHFKNRALHLSAIFCGCTCAFLHCHFCDCLGLPTITWWKSRERSCPHFLRELHDKRQLVVPDMLGDGSSIIFSIKVIAALIKLHVESSYMTWQSWNKQARQRLMHTS